MPNFELMEYTILIVDNEPESISQVIDSLREMGLTKRIYSAPNGKIAYDLALKYTPSLILTDWDMPEMNGLELVKKLKLNQQTKDIPVIMITGIMTSPQKLQDAFDAEVHDFLRKPYNNLEFYSRVNNSMKLHKAHSELIKSNEKLNELNSLKDKLSSVIVHDVRAPLANLSSVLQILTDDTFTMESSEANMYYHQINQQVNHTMDLLQNLLDWSQSQLLQETRLEDVKVHHLVNKIIKSNQMKAREKDIRLLNQIPTNFELTTDPGMLSFVFRNLIVNAIKFTEKGNIEIKAVMDGNTATFEVCDDGIGMKPSTSQMLFKRKGVTPGLGTNDEKGSGVGLILCHEYILQHLGEMKVSSTLGKGSTFCFSIPLEQSESL